MTHRYLGNRLFRIDLILVLVGWTPLWGIVLLAAVGLWPDPNPNPIGPRILFFFTAWPAIIFLELVFCKPAASLNDCAGMTAQGRVNA